MSSHSQKMHNMRMTCEGNVKVEASISSFVWHMQSFNVWVL